MKNRRATIAKYLLFTLALIDFIAEFIHHRELIFILRPTLLPMLLLYYVSQVDGNWNKAHRLMVCAILFSWVGDVCLLLTPENPEDMEILGITKNKFFFFGGVGGFLVSHLFFISVYLQSKIEAGTALFRRQKLPFLGIFLYVLAMIYVVVPPVYAHPEKYIATFPVIVYACVLGAMVSFALNRYGQVAMSSFWTVFIGSLFFLFSDSIIALNFLAFEGLIPRANFWIVTTFFVAEFLIARGVLKEYET